MGWTYSTQALRIRSVGEAMSVRVLGKLQEVGAGAGTAAAAAGLMQSVRSVGDDPSWTTSAHEQIRSRRVQTGPSPTTPERQTGRVHHAHTANLQPN